MKNLYEYVYFSERPELDDYLIEKLHLDKDIEVQEKPNDSSANVRAPWIGVMQKDYDKMNEYHRKGSKPQVLVNTIKDSEKLKRRFAVAVSMKWQEAIEKFGDALVNRGIFNRAEVDKYIQVHSN